MRTRLQAAALALLCGVAGCQSYGRSPYAAGPQGPYPPQGYGQAYPGAQGYPQAAPMYGAPRGQAMTPSYGPQAGYAAQSPYGGPTAPPRGQQMYAGDSSRYGDAPAGFYDDVNTSSYRNAGNSKSSELEALQARLAMLRAKVNDQRDASRASNILADEEQSFDRYETSSRSTSRFSSGSSGSMDSLMDLDRQIAAIASSQNQNARRLQELQMQRERMVSQLGEDSLSGTERQMRAGTYRSEDERMDEASRDRIQSELRQQQANRGPRLR